MNDWDDIRFFLALARAGSISQAAKSLRVNHSTVSRRIQGLEEKHGVRLFTRKRDGYQMTEAADAIYLQAIEAEAWNQKISRTLLGQDQRLEGGINLTMPHDVFEHCLAEDLAIFAKQYPGIRLNLMVSKGVKNLAVQEADLAIRLTASPPDYLVGRKVAGLQHAIYAPSHYDLTSSVGVVVWSGEVALPDWALSNFAEPYIALQVDDLTAMLAAVKAGFGVARMPCYLPDSLRLRELRKLPIPQERSDWSVWLLNHVDLRKTARVQRCREFLLSALTEKQALFEGLNNN